MKNINSKKAKTEIGKISFEIALHQSYSDRFYMKAESDNSADYKYGRVCFIKVKKNIIRLAEEFGINYYQVESTMKDLLNEKEELFIDYNQAFEDWRNAEEKEGEK